MARESCRSTLCQGGMTLEEVDELDVWGSQSVGVKLCFGASEGLCWVLVKFSCMMVKLEKSIIFE